MKILHLANFYHETSGGIKTYLDKKRDYFVSNGLPFRLIIPDEVDRVEAMDQASVVYRLSAPVAPINPLYRMIWDLSTVHSIVRHEKPDVIEVNDKFTLAGLAYFYRKIFKYLPTVGFHHERLDENMAIYWRNPLLSKIVHYMAMQTFCASFDRIICASRHTAGEIETIAPDKVEIINLGTDIDRFSPEYADQPLRERLAAGADRLILYVGRLAREKNLALLPEFMHLLQERGVSARLVVAGVGQDADLLTDSGRTDIDLIGFVADRAEMARLMASADLLVFPSVKEPYGLVPLEALASGLPVICSNQGGVLEYSDTEAVKSVEPTPECFAAAALELFSSPREALRKTARKHAEKFSWDKTFERQNQMYENIIRNGSTPAGAP